MKPVKDNIDCPVVSVILLSFSSKNIFLFTCCKTKIPATAPTSNFFKRHLKFEAICINRLKQSPLHSTGYLGLLIKKTQNLEIEHLSHKAFLEPYNRGISSQPGPEKSVQPKQTGIRKMKNSSNDERKNQTQRR